VQPMGECGVPAVCRLLGLGSLRGSLLEGKASARALGLQALPACHSAVLPSQGPLGLLSAGIRAAPGASSSGLSGRGTA